MILYMDMMSGISGDMTLGGLVDLGVPPEWIQAQLAPVLDGFEIQCETVFKSHLRAVNLDVRVTDQKTSRNYTDICQMIESADLPDSVRANALTAFEKIARAEAHIHGRDLAQVHFHEIGGIGSLVDIIGTFLAIDYLGVTRVAASVIPLGSGFIDCAHGKIPVPVPATLAVLKGLPVRQSDAKTEIVTPTGAAIVATLVDSFGPMPAMAVEKIGYGAGKRDTGSRVPNLLRLVLGKENCGQVSPEGSGSRHTRKDQVVSILSNVDDMNPEVLGAVMDLLLDMGALDVSFSPIYMKKNRPATRIEVIARPGDEARLSDAILTHTTAIGVRFQACDRMLLQRETMEMDLGEPIGTIQVKKVITPQGHVRILPEFEACRQKANALELPIQAVYDHVAGRANPLDSDKARLYKTREGKA